MEIEAQIICRYCKNPINQEVESWHYEQKCCRECSEGLSHLWQMFGCDDEAVEFFNKIPKRCRWAYDQFESTPELRWMKKKITEPLTKMGDFTQMEEILCTYCYRHKIFWDCCNWLKRIVNECDGALAEEMK